MKKRTLTPGRLVQFTEGKKKEWGFVTFVPRGVCPLWTKEELEFSPKVGHLSNCCINDIDHPECTCPALERKFPFPGMVTSSPD